MELNKLLCLNLLEYDQLWSILFEYVGMLDAECDAYIGLSVIAVDDLLQVMKSNQL